MFENTSIAIMYAVTPLPTYKNNFHKELAMKIL